MLVDRRTFGKLVLGAGVVGPSILSRSARAQDPRPGDELVVGVWGGPQYRIVQEYVEKPLVEKYGCRVRYILGTTPARRAQAYNERGRPSMDVIYLNIYESRAAVADGVTQPPSPAAVPNYSGLYDIARKGGYGVAFNPITVVYDRRLTDRPVTSWRDIWNPEWRGRVSWPVYPGASGVAALLMTARVWGGSETDMDVAFEKLRELRPLVAVHDTYDDLFSLFDAEKVGISVEFGSVARRYQETRNPNLVVAKPVEGQVIAMNVACITEGARNQKLAEEWVNLHLSTPCLEAFARDIYYSPTMRDVPIPPFLRSRILDEEDVAKLIDFDWEIVSQSQPKWLARFNRAVGA